MNLSTLESTYDQQLASLADVFREAGPDFRLIVTAAVLGMRDAAAVIEDQPTRVINIAAARLASAGLAAVLLSLEREETLEREAKS